jgi:hypothetical protein
METIRVTVEGAEVNFDAARKRADDIAAGKLKEPLLVAWYDGVAGLGHPDVPECTDRPGWQVYAESRGGELTIDVNSGQYILIYSETALEGA